MVATAESCTGGMIAAAITDIAGSSAVLDRGFVTYSNEAKQEMIGVSAATLEAHGAVSKQTAIEMAEGALQRSRASFAVSVTGIARARRRICGEAGRACSYGDGAEGRRDGSTVNCACTVWIARQCAKRQSPRL